MVEKYEKYLELLRKRYIRNGIIELGDLSVESNQYELVSALSNLEDINRYLAIATDNNSSLQILKKDYTTFYESLRKKVVDEYNTLYDERIDELYTDVLNQVKIGTVEVDYRVVGKDVSPYAVPEVVVEEVKLTPQELQEVKVLATIIKDDDEEDELVVGGNEDKFEDVEVMVDVVDSVGTKEGLTFEDDLEDEPEIDGLDEDDAMLYGLYDEDDDEDDNELEFENEEELVLAFDDKEENEEEKTLVSSTKTPMAKKNRLSLGSLIDLGDDKGSPDLELPKGLRRDFSVGLREPVRKSAFVPKRPVGMVSNERKDFIGQSQRKEDKNKGKVKVVDKNRNLNELVYDKIDNFSESLVNKIVKKIKDGD